MQIDRREFLIAATAACGTTGLAGSAASEATRPNILWLTCEDTGPQLGCYGDTYATTPNLDQLAAKGMKYACCWSNAPVCAPARTAIITGLYPPSTGSEHMRSMTSLPDYMRMYPCFLRDAGYYCTNNSKEDYNLAHTGKVWDESSGKAHWKNRKPGQPFFAIFNFTVTHESQIRTRPHKWEHDPAKVRVPAYHPDTIEVRQDWAQYYDNITRMDGMVGQRLKELEEAGLAGETIVFFYGDHGSGMPRSKRWPYNSGLHVPLIVYIPPKFSHLAPKEYKAGATSDRLVSFVDLAPTLLSLVGTKLPDWMQGHAFMGKHEAPPQQFVFGFRGRMDERYDMVRSVRDQRYVYIRNYMPHLIYGQHVSYMFQTPTTQVWKRLFDEGKLSPEQSHFWKTKPPEELYDLRNDPDEAHNLANSPAHREVLERMRKAQRDLAVRIRDVGFLPESEIHTRSAGSTPYEVGHAPDKYPMERVMAAAEQASLLRDDALPELIKMMRDGDSAVRYWAILGILMRGKEAAQQDMKGIYAALADDSPSVRVAAARALGQYGEKADLDKALAALLVLARHKDESGGVALMAINAIDALDKNAASAIGQIRQLKPVSGQRTAGEYVVRVAQDMFANLRE